MGDIVTLKPLAETLEFEGEARAKVDLLVAEMISALHRFTNAHDQQEEGRAHDEIKRLQEALAKAQSRVEFVKDMLDSANENRGDLWNELPHGQSAVVLACRDDGSYVAAMNVQRWCARINCSQLSIYEGVGGKRIKVA